MESTIDEIEKFDNRFPKSGIRQYKYPKVELDKMNRQQLTNSIQWWLNFMKKKP